MARVRPAVAQGLALGQREVVRVERRRLRLLVRLEESRRRHGRLGAAGMRERDLDRADAVDPPDRAHAAAVRVAECPGLRDRRLHLRGLHGTRKRGNGHELVSDVAVRAADVVLRPPVLAQVVPRSSGSSSTGARLPQITL